MSKHERGFVGQALKRQANEQDAPTQDGCDTLTDREREVVRWAIQGMTNQEIASKVGISSMTVKTHMRNIFAKLKINRRLQLLLHRLTERE